MNVELQIETEPIVLDILSDEIESGLVRRIDVQKTLLLKHYFAELNTSDRTTQECIRTKIIKHFQNLRIVALVGIRANIIEIDLKI